MIVDSHQHFWKYDPVVHEWINGDMSVIRKDFLPEDLLHVFQQNNIEGCVAVQADQSEKETDFLIGLANTNPFIKAVVGWVDLRAENIKERLAHYKQYPVVKGFRHILQGEDLSFMLQPDFLRGIAALQEFGFTYDVLIFPKHLSSAIELVKQFPEQPFVIDHMAKPFIKDGLIDDWKKGMRTLAQFPNVYCKISGMVTEAGWKNWKREDFTPYLDVVTESFGVNRLMYGSDWPVCLVAASYEKVLGLVKNYFSSFSPGEREAVFGGNASRFYGLL
ncbi:MAG: amidohydrolase 2 [Sediminibacterium sp.]|nr:amidohydrolase 2 [Sediminibacterium sp.]